MRIFGIDPGSIRTGYGCVDTEGGRHRLVTCGVLSGKTGASLPDRLHAIHDGLTRLLADSRPECVVIENLFHSRNVKSALVLGHARGVAVLAAVQAGVPMFEYTPAEIKLAVVGYGRAEKVQVQGMVKLLLGLAKAPAPYDAADALAVALCHAHAGAGPAGPAAGRRTSRSQSKYAKSWRHFKPAADGRPVQ